MILVLHEHLATPALYQEFTVGAKNLQVTNIGVHLYRHGAPAGTVAVLVHPAGGGTPLVTSPSLSLASIGGPETYWHGYQRFSTPVMLKKNTTYRVSLSTASYSFSESAYIGWVDDRTWSKVSPLYSPGLYALDFELFTTDYPEKGTY